MSFAERIAHVDMDAFFVEVERLRDPGLRGVPVVVGGLGRRGVVSSASYEARTTGVGSGMPIAQARRRCPSARFLPPDHAAYREASAGVFAVLESFTPAVEPLSVDEAFLDVGGLRLHFPSPEEVAGAIRAALREHTGLPASVGVGTSKLIAKLAGRRAKPDGVWRVPAGEEVAFLHPLPVRALWGVGEATFSRLEALGIATVGDLAGFPVAALERRLGPTLGRHLHELAHARDPRPVEPASGVKSVSVESTYDTDLVDPERIEAELLAHADRLAWRLRSAGVRARTVHLKVRFGDFTTVDRSRTLPAAVDTAHDLYGAARTLADRAGIGRRPVRLLGLGGGGLEPGDAPRQMGLEGPSWEDLERAVDRVRGRFGRASIHPARLTGEPGRTAGGAPPPSPDVT
jgi:DNA polymerase-4